MTKRQALGVREGSQDLEQAAENANQSGQLADLVAERKNGLGVVQVNASAADRVVQFTDELEALRQLHQAEQVAITQLERRLAEQVQCLQSVQAEMRSRDEELAQLKRQAAAHAVQQAQTQVQRQELKTMRLQLDDAKVRRSQDKEAQAWTLSERFNELAILTRMLEEREAQLNAKDQQIRAERQNRERIKKSVSWRATWPLRALARPIIAARQRRSLRKEQVALIEESGLFDVQWYLSRYASAAKSGMNPIEHYLQHGAAEGLDPNKDFSTSWYLATNPDVSGTGMNALVHYIKFGSQERRSTGPSAEQQ